MPKGLAVTRHQAITPARSEGPLCYPPGTPPASACRRGFCPFDRRSCPPSSAACSRPPPAAADPETPSNQKPITFHFVSDSCQKSCCSLQSCQQLETIVPTMYLCTQGVPYKRWPRKFLLNYSPQREMFQIILLRIIILAYYCTLYILYI